MKGTKDALVIVGDGGHAKDIRAIAEDCGYEEIIGLDDKSKKYPIDWMFDLDPICNEYILGANWPDTRNILGDRIYGTKLKMATLIHPSAYVGPQVFLGEGCVIAQNVVLTTQIAIERGTHINVGASVSQNSMIGYNCSISPGARVCGDCKIGNNVILGANSTVIHLRNVGNNVTVGAGAVVVNDISSNSIVKGVPAK